MSERLSLKYNDFTRMASWQFCKIDIGQHREGATLTGTARWRLC